MQFEIHLVGVQIYENSTDLLNLSFDLLEEKKLNGYLRGEIHSHVLQVNVDATMFFSAHDAVPAHIRIVHQKTNKYQACESEPNFSKLEQN